MQQPWHVCVKTNKHGQLIYGPSLAGVEATVKKIDSAISHATALGRTKSTHELLVLHYFATDSAGSWHRLLCEWFPQGQWKSSGVIREQISRIFDRIHVAPSHRRPPHPCWTGPMSLLLRLLLGHGKTALLSMLRRPKKQDPLQVLVRGFSAGSYVGLTILHLLWNMGSMGARGKLGVIACPPKLLETAPPHYAKHLILMHYHGDQLCMWRPTNFHYLASRTVYIEGDSSKEGCVASSFDLLA